MFSSGGGQEAAGSLRLFVGVLYTIFALLQSGGGFGAAAGCRYGFAACMFDYM